MNEPTWLFHLVKGVQFHDGTPLTAEDVKLPSTGAGPGPSRFQGLRGPDRAGGGRGPAHGQDRDQGPLRHPAIHGKPGHDHVQAYVEKPGDDAQATKPNGTGAYKLTEWVRGDHLTLVANERLPGAPKIKQVVIRPLTNAATRTAALSSGEVHLVDDVSVRDVDRVKADSKLDLWSARRDRAIYLEMDQAREKSPRLESPTGKNPFLDARVRRAVLLASTRRPSSSTS